MLPIFANEVPITLKRKIFLHQRQCPQQPTLNYINARLFKSLLSSFFFQSALFAVEREKELAGGRRCVRDEGGRNWFCVYAANPQTLKKALASIFSFFFVRSLFFCPFIISFILSVSTGFGNLFAFDASLSLSFHAFCVWRAFGTFCFVWHRCRGEAVKHDWRLQTNDQPNEDVWHLFSTTLSC